MTRPVVCQLVHTLHVGGAEVLAGNLARALRDRYHFVFACLDELGPGADRLRGLSADCFAWQAELLADLEREIDDLLARDVAEQILAGGVKDGDTVKAGKAVVDLPGNVVSAVGDALSPTPSPSNATVDPATSSASARKPGGGAQ